MKTSSLLLLALFCVQATQGSTEKCSFNRFLQAAVQVQVKEGRCEEQCDLNPQCTHYQAEPLFFHFRWGTFENCYLLKGNVSWSEIKPATKTTCGIKNTWRKIGDDYMGTNCLFKLIPYRAYPLETAEDCFQLCKEHSHCNHFNFIREGQQSTCQLMQGFHKGMKDTTLVSPKDSQSISCGYMQDYKFDKAAEIEETTQVQPEELQDDYTYYYYAASYLGGLLSALVLYLLCCACAKYFIKSDEK